LINAGMASKTQGRNSVVMGFDAHPLAITLLVRVRGYHRAILLTADLTG
jgi:hypothetical protein